MSFIKAPVTIKRSFDSSSKIRSRRYIISRESRPEARSGYIPRKLINKITRTAGGRWPKNLLDYDFLDRCKEVVCRIRHPNGYFQHKDTEYRLSILRWSRGAYLDIRKYVCGQPTGQGILIHQDVWEVLFPELQAALREVQSQDTRDPEQIQKVRVIAS